MEKLGLLFLRGLRDPDDLVELPRGGHLNDLNVNIAILFCEFVKVLNSIYVTSYQYMEMNSSKNPNLKWPKHGGKTGNK
eukprot:6456663-Amphidinium_carterae.1